MGEYSFDEVSKCVIILIQPRKYPILLISITLIKMSNF